MSKIYSILKKPFFGRFMVTWRSPFSDEDDKNWEKISFSSDSNAEIKAMWADGIGQSKATIVMAHPMGKEAKGYWFKNGYTELLLAEGYNLLIFDFNGFGESDLGNFNYFDDVIAAGLYAKKRNPKLPIGYFGISLGAMWGTVGLAERKDVFQCVILESGATTFPEFWRHFPLAYRMLIFFNFCFPRFASRIVPVERVKELDYLDNVLFIYSKTDKYMPVSMGERIHANCDASSELFIIDDAPHANIMKSNYKEVYSQKIVTFFNDNFN